MVRALATSLLAACTWGTYTPGAGDAGAQDSADDAGQAPTTLDQTPGSSPEALVVTSTQLIWARHQTGYVMQCMLPQCVGSANVLETTPEPNRVHLVQNSQTLFWSDDQTPAVHYAPLGGGAMTNVSAASAIGGMLDDGTNVYWTETASGTVQECTPGCQSSTPLASGQGSPIGLALQGSTLYWANNAAEQIGTCTLPTCTAQTIPLNVHPMRFAADANGIFLTTDSGVMQCSSGCSTLAPFWPGASCTFIASDTMNVYFATADGRLMECPRSGCASPRVLAMGQGTVGAIALDGGHVYWTSTDQGLVMRISK